MKVIKISSAWRGKVVIFHAFDGKDYTAHVEKVRNGVAKLLYQPRLRDGSRPWAYAYVDDINRIA